MRSALLARFERHADAGLAALSDEHGIHGYEALLERASSIAAHLLTIAAAGSSATAPRAPRTSLEGERVALLVEPGASFVAALYAVWLAGGCAIVLSPLHPAPESAYFCTDAEVRIIVTSRTLAAKLGEAAAGRTLVEVDADVAFDDPPTLRAGMTSLGGSRVREANEDTDAALQLYTSGTTGRPKGAVLTHANLAMQQELVGDAWRFTREDVLLHALPLHHMHGLAIALFTALGAGATVRMLPGFDAIRIWNELGAATVFMAVPTMYSRLCDAFDSADAETREQWTASARALRLATSGSAALPVSLASRWEAIAGIIPVERFGMTEIGVGMTNPIEGPRAKGMVGFPLPTVETRIVGDDGAPAASGELWIRGPSVFSGYFRRDEATRAAFVAAGDGGLAWFKTGDTVTRSASATHDSGITPGPFRILGRNSVDILKSGGYKLSALEIEEAILELAAVREVAVVGVPDESWGDRVIACVVAQPGREADCSADAVRAHVRDKLAVYKCPKNVVVMAALPRNAMGKVVKPELSKLLAATRFKDP